MPITDPKVKIKALLTSNWNAANTNSQTPQIHTGWYNSAWETTPQVTVTNPEYSVIDGGDTGVTAISGDGLVTLMQCDLMVGCWAHPKMKTSGGAEFRDSGINVKDLTYNMSMEVRRIIRANMLSDPELEFMTWLGMNDMVDDRIQPVMFRYDNSVRLVWKDTFSV